MKVSKMEFAKALKSLRDVASPEEFRNIKQILSPPTAEAAIEAAIKGLSEEDEFALMCRLMGTTTNLVHLDQRFIIPGDYIPPDFLARFQPGCSFYGFGRKDSKGFKCLIEVKSTNKDNFKLGGSLLRRQRNFADAFGLPLLIAVRFLKFNQNSFWIIVEDSDRTSSSVKVTYQQMIDGVRHVLWDEYWYSLRPGIYFKRIFDANYCGEGFKNTEYGTQREFQIIIDNQTLSLTDDEALIYSLFFEGFNLKEVGSQHRGSITYQTLAPQVVACSIADMVYTFNRLQRNEKGEVIYNPSKIIVYSDTKHEGILVNRDFIDPFAKELINKRLLFKLGIGDPDTHLCKWRQYGGQK
jgi:hypothetical protein